MVLMGISDCCRRLYRARSVMRFTGRAVFVPELVLSCTICHGDWAPNSPLARCSASSRPGLGGEAGGWQCLNRASCRAWKLAQATPFFE